jgi:hypothetical protein
MHLHSKFSLSLLPCALMALAVSGCKPPESASNSASNSATSSSSGTGNAATVSVGSAKPYTGDTLIWGEYGSLTGDTATFGNSTHNALEMAVAEINAKNPPLGKQIELKVEDDGSKVEQVPSVIKKLSTRKARSSFWAKSPVPALSPPRRFAKRRACRCFRPLPPTQKSLLAANGFFAPALSTRFKAKRWSNSPARTSKPKPPP